MPRRTTRRSWWWVSLSAALTRVPEWQPGMPCYSRWRGALANNRCTLEWSSARTDWFLAKATVAHTAARPSRSLASSRATRHVREALCVVEESGTDATLREDLVVLCAVAEDVLKHAPDPEPPYFRVPKVIER